MNISTADLLVKATLKRQSVQENLFNYERSLILNESSGVSIRRKITNMSREGLDTDSYCEDLIVSTQHWIIKTRYIAALRKQLAELDQEVATLKLMCTRFK